MHYLETDLNAWNHSPEIPEELVRHCIFDEMGGESLLH